MSSMQIVKDPEGQSFIPPSQRPDGTWRKPIRVRSGYVPQEEQPVYVSKGRGVGEKSPYPVGLSANDVDSNRATTPMGYFDARELLKQAAGIPGLNFVESADPLVPTKAKSKSKKKGATTTTTTAVPAATGNAATSTASKPSSTSTSTNVNQSGAGAAAVTDPSKRLRNLKKRLKEIEDLEKRISSGDLTNPEKEQLEKLKRKEEVEDEIEDLERQISNLNFS